jgi:hypothetical protein
LARRSLNWNKKTGIKNIIRYSHIGLLKWY